MNLNVSITLCNSESGKQNKDCRYYFLDYEQSPYMLYSFPYLAFLLKFAKNGFVNHPPHFYIHLRMVVLSCLAFFNQRAYTSKVFFYWNLLRFSDQLPSKPKQPASDISKQYAVVPVTACRFMFPINLMSVVLMEYSWNVFWRDRRTVLRTIDGSSTV